MSVFEEEMYAQGKASGQGMFMSSRLQPDDEFDEFDEDDAPVASRDPSVKTKKAKKGRQITDSFCLFIFVAYIIGMAWIYMHAYENGVLDKLTHGYNYEGNVCGFSTGYEQVPMTYWCAKKNFVNPKTGETVPWKLLDPICVETCPDGTDHHDCPGDLQIGEWTGSPAEGGELKTRKITRMVTREKDLKTKQAFGYYCLPTGHSAQAVIDGIFGSGSLQNGFKTAAIFLEAMSDAKYFLAGFVVMAIVLAYGYLFLMSAFIKPIILGTFALVDLSLFLLSGYFGLIAMPGVQVKVVESNDFLTPTLGEDGAHQAATIGAAVCSIAFVLFTIYWCISAAAIEKTVQAVQHTFEIVQKMPTLLFAPAFCIFCQMVTFIFMVSGSIWILSLGKVKTTDYLAEALMGTESTVQGLYREFEFTSSQWVMIWLWGFGFLWVFEMCKAWNQFACANAIVEFECTNTATCTPVSIGYYKGFRYHLGTIAFGAFVMGMIDMCSFIVELMLKQMKDKDGKLNNTVKAMGCICACFFRCLKEIVSATNQLVYADTVLYSHGFLKATKNVMLTYLANPVTMATVMGTTKYIKMAGTLLITVTGTLLSYWITKTFHGSFDQNMGGLENPGIMDFAQNISSPYAATVLGVTVAGFFISVSVAQSFMTTFDMLTDTVNYCNVQKDDLKKQGGYAKM